MSGGAYGEINSPAPPRHNLCTCARNLTHLCKPRLRGCTLIVRLLYMGVFSAHTHVENSFVIINYVISTERKRVEKSRLIDRFLHACGYAALSRNDMAWVYFRAEGSLMLTLTRNKAVHFTPPCDKAVLCYGLERYFTKTACRFYFTWRARFPQNSTVCCFALRGERGHQVARAVTEHSVVLALCEKAYFTLPIDFSTSALRAFGRNDKRGAYHKKLFFGGRG